ncbi:hypothetical protein LDENG_00221350 [Lucifuga dentata]|nr:hypothetical protein LDENG_00221350 [Lucifuga dentata]
MKLLEILSTLMMDDTYKGRGKYHSKDQDIRERATVLQTEIENFVHVNTHSVQMAKKALQSFLRAYTTYPAHLKHIFHIRSLHLGHTAKSFGLRDAPQGLTAHAAANPTRGSAAKNPNTAAQKRFGAGQRSEVSLLRSEFSSGLEGRDGRKKKKRKKKKKLEEEEEEEEE